MEKIFRVEASVSELYGILALEAKIVVDRKYEPFRHSHSRWMSDFEDYKSEFIPRLALAIRDYTVKVVAGEMRHGSHCIHKTNPDVTSTYSRHGAFNLAERYTPESVLRAGVLLFDDGDWGGGYGGRAWKKIAEAGLMYGHMPDVVFIDHCVDLSHNSSVYFDKPNNDILEMGSASRYKDLLNYKRDESLERVLFAIKRSHRFHALLMRAVTIGVIDVGEYYMTALEDESMRQFTGYEDLYDFSIDAVLSYDGVEWGKLEMAYAVVEDHEDDDEEEEEEEEEYGEEDEEEEKPWVMVEIEEFRSIEIDRFEEA